MTITTQSDILNLIIGTTQQALVIIQGLRDQGSPEFTYQDALASKHSFVGLICRIQSNISAYISNCPDRAFNEEVDLIPPDFSRTHAFEALTNPTWERPLRRIHNLAQERLAYESPLPLFRPRSEEAPPSTIPTEDAAPSPNSPRSSPVFPVNNEVQIIRHPPFGPPSYPSLTASLSPSSTRPRINLKDFFYRRDSAPPTPAPIEVPPSVHEIDELAGLLKQNPAQIVDRFADFRNQRSIKKCIFIIEQIIKKIDINNFRRICYLSSNSLPLVLSIFFHKERACYPFARILITQTIPQSKDPSVIRVVFSDSIWTKIPGEMQSRFCISLEAYFKPIDIAQMQRDGKAQTKEKVLDFINALASQAEKSAPVEPSPPVLAQKRKEPSPPIEPSSEQPPSELPFPFISATNPPPPKETDATPKKSKK